MKGNVFVQGTLKVHKLYKPTLMFLLILPSVYYEEGSTERSRNENYNVEKDGGDL